MRTRIAVLVLALAGTTALGPTASARSVVEPPQTVASGITVTGNGYGHGRGMSQYGAQGAAKKGLTADQILTFYYPGTTASTTTGRIRVLISKDTDRNLVVRPAKGLTLRDLATGKVYRLPVGAPKRWRLALVNGKVRVTYLAGGAWKIYRPGGRATLVGGGQFHSTSGLLSLLIAGVDHRYRGDLRFTTGRTVNVVGMDGYLRGVVPAEMPASWQTQALRAQAVAARTYAAFERAENIDDTFQVYDTTRSQVYGGYDSELTSTNNAVVATSGRIRSYAGKPAFTQFSASNGGFTVAGSQPYLVAKADPYDQAYRGWTLPLNTAALQKARPDLGALQSVQVLSRDGNGQWGGRASQVKLTYAKGSTTVAGSTLRSWLGLRSDWFLFS